MQVRPLEAVYDSRRDRTLRRRLVDRNGLSVSAAGVDDIEILEKACRMNRSYATRRHRNPVPFLAPLQSKYRPRIAKILRWSKVAMMETERY